MISQSDIIADLHTHSIFSKHAYSTIQENIAAAEKMNLKYLAITDHIYNDGTPLDIKNEGTRCRHLEKEVNSYRKEGQPYVISGGEFNIAQKLDHWDKFKKLRWRPIGLHGFHLDIKQLSLGDLYKEFANPATVVGVRGKVYMAALVSCKRKPVFNFVGIAVIVISER